ncbi:uncharacterized protein N7500_002588 [Penicillium coprophilum]|uniref:uncharacterized protein n=1 Tax=Penicillium coprophilum TaxID=36646 RepID=UPI002394AA8D|nr:uncharacterized protein N7500_002588 [Penicillium coprophilum]KAJ5169805.1 hypothetical protein N7500_002588 [Penicillium coprophilum]
MDPFERLPVELIYHILLFTSDFVGVESLLVASPRVRAVFLDRPGLIFQEMMESNSISSAAPIRKIIQKVRLLHSPSSNFHNFEEYIQCTERTGDQLGIHSNDAEVLQMMQVCAQIQRLACTCLWTMQENFISAVGASPAGPLSGSMRAQKAAKPFSWVEESNMYWGLWHLRHYSDLHHYASRLNWPEESMKRAREYHTWNDIERMTTEVISTVAAVLSDLGLSPVYSYPHLGEHKESIQAVWWYPSQTPPPLFHSLEFARGMNVPIWPSPPTPPDDLVTESWNLDVRGCGRRTIHMEMYKNWAYQRPNPGYTRLSIQPYRRLGIFVWDLWRMYSTGLVVWNYRGLRTPAPDGDAELVELLGVHHASMEEWRSRWLTLAGTM